MICLLLIIMVIFINGIENAEQKVKHLHTVLKEEDIDAKTKAWLLMVESGRVDNEEMRRITPKSIFIAPLLTNPTIKCKDGYRYDHLGQCVKVFQPDPKLQLELLLKKLNKIYSEKKEEEEEHHEESNKRISEPSNGPLQFSIPVSINVDKGAPPSDANKSESLQINKDENLQVERHNASIKFESLKVDDAFQEMQLKHNQTFSQIDPLRFDGPFEKLQDQDPTTITNGSVKPASHQFSTPVSTVLETNKTFFSSNIQAYPPTLNSNFPEPQKMQGYQHPPPPIPIKKLNDMLISRPHYFSSPEWGSIDKNVKPFGSDTRPRPFGFYNKLFTFDTPHSKNNYTVPTTPTNKVNDSQKMGSPQFFPPVPVSVEKNVNLFNLETKSNLYQENDKPIIEENTQRRSNISSVEMLDKHIDGFLEFGSETVPALVTTEKDLDTTLAYNKTDPENIDSTFFTTENVEVINNYNLTNPLSRLNSTFNGQPVQVSTPELIEPVQTEKSMFDFKGEEPTEFVDEFSVTENMPEDNNQTLSEYDNMTNRALENEAFNISTPVPIDVETTVTSTDSDILLNATLVDDKPSVVPEKVETSSTSPAQPVNRLNGKFSLSFLPQPTKSSAQFSNPIFTGNHEKNILNSTAAPNTSSVNDTLPVPKQVQIENNNSPIPLNRLNATFSVSLLTEPSQEPLQFSIPVSINVEKDAKSTGSDAFIKRLNGTFSLLIG